MDVVDKVQRCLSKWDKGGSEQWCVQGRLLFCTLIEPSCSVNVLAGPHSNPADPDSIDTLTTVYHALLVSVLTSWPVQPALTVDALVQFVQSMFERLPSSSSTATNPPNAVPFSEVLVDVIWSVDTELEDFISDAKSALAEEQKGADASKTFDRDAVARGLRTKQSAEEDKETLAVIVRRLLVRTFIEPIRHVVGEHVFSRWAFWMQMCVGSGLTSASSQTLVWSLTSLLSRKRRSALEQDFCASNHGLIMSPSVLIVAQLQAEQVQPSPRTIRRLQQACH